METVTLVAAVIAAVAALVTSGVTLIGQSSMETKKWLRAQQEQADTARRLAVADLVQALACCAQAMTWLTWKAVKVPAKVNADDVQSYTIDIKGLLPRVVSAHLTAVAVNPRIDELAKELVQELYTLDSQIGLACLQFEDDRSGGVQALAAAYTPAEAYFDDLHRKFSGVLGIQAAVSTAPNLSVPQIAPVQSAT